MQEPLCFFSSLSFNFKKKEWVCVRRAIACGICVVICWSGGSLYVSGYGSRNSQGWSVMRKQLRQCRSATWIQIPLCSEMNMVRFPSKWHQSNQRKGLPKIAISSKLSQRTQSVAVNNHRLAVLDSWPWALHDFLLPQNSEDGLCDQSFLSKKSLSIGEVKEKSKAFAAHMPRAQKKPGCATLPSGAESWHEGPTWLCADFTLTWQRDKKLKKG